jgi:hypothetical protein
MSMSMAMPMPNGWANEVGAVLQIPVSAIADYIVHDNATALGLVVHVCVLASHE